MEDAMSQRNRPPAEKPTAPLEDAKKRAEQPTRLLERLSEIVAADAIPTWLETPNRAFDGRTPQELIESGEVDRLWEMIRYLEYGAGS
jgi:hypothetical protein